MLKNIFGGVLIPDFFFHATKIPTKFYISNTILRSLPPRFFISILKESKFSQRQTKPSYSFKISVFCAVKDTPSPG